MFEGPAAKPRAPRHGDLKAAPLTCKVPGNGPVHFPLTGK
jgi:hypothetical protein